LPSSLGSGADIDPADEMDPCRISGGRGSLRAIRRQLRAMHEAARPFIADSARTAYWCQVWEVATIRATVREESSRKRFYYYRLTAIVSAIIVPSLVGLNLSGTGGTAVRWLTFTLSLIAALSTAILTLFRFGDRWLMYRRLGNELIAAGWRMINGSGTDLDKAWSSFTDTTNKAISSYYTEYATEIVATVQLKFNGQSEGQDERLGQTSQPR
jgi:Protein of unknown function (DUF4231)